MGVTIHFEGRLKDENAFVRLVKKVEEIAKRETWLTERFDNAEATLLRVRANEKEWDYIGPTKGVTLYLNEDCDPIRLEFDKDLYIQEFVKTQFSGVKTHIQVVKLLRTFEPFFRKLKVQDEGEYWETEDENQLAEHIRWCNEAIAEEAKKHPEAQVKVKDPQGRIMDMLE